MSLSMAEPPIDPADGEHIGDRASVWQMTARKTWLTALSTFEVGQILQESRSGKNVTYLTRRGGRIGSDVGGRVEGDAMDQAEPRSTSGSDAGHPEQHRVRACPGPGRARWFRQCPRSCPSQRPRPPEGAESRKQLPPRFASRPGAWRRPYSTFDIERRSCRDKGTRGRYSRSCRRCSVKEDLI